MANAFLSPLMFSCYKWLTAHGTVGVRLRACVLILPIIIEETVIYSVSFQKWPRSWFNTKMLTTVNFKIISQSLWRHHGRVCMVGFIQLSQHILHGKNYGKGRQNKPLNDVNWFLSSQCTHACGKTPSGCLVVWFSRTQWQILSMRHACRESWLL